MSNFTSCITVFPYSDSSTDQISKLNCFDNTVILGSNTSSSTFSSNSEQVNIFKYCTIISYDFLSNKIVLKSNNIVFSTNKKVFSMKKEDFFMKKEDFFMKKEDFSTKKNALFTKKSVLFTIREVFSSYKKVLFT